MNEVAAEERPDGAAGGGNLFVLVDLLARRNQNNEMWEQMRASESFAREILTSPESEKIKGKRNAHR